MTNTAPAGPPVTTDADRSDGDPSDGNLSDGYAADGYGTDPYGAWNHLGEYAGGAGRWPGGSGPGVAVQEGRAEPPWGRTPLRVIHVGQSLVRAGVEQWLKAMIRFLDPNRVRLVRVIVTAPDSVDPSLLAEMPIAVEIGQAEAVVRAAREADLLLCWGPAELGSWLRECRPKLCVFVAHGEGMWTRRILTGCAPVLDHAVAVSRRVRERITGPASTVIHNGVDAAHIARSRSRQAVRQSLGFEARDFVAGFVGRFSAEKRPHAVLEAVALLPAHFKALMIGWGAQQEELRRLAQAWLPGRCRFVVGRDYLGDYYHAMDALCMVSDAEGFSLAALEGMMCGVPLIATPVGFIPEIVKHRVNAVVVSGSVHSISRALELVHDHPAWARGAAAEAKIAADKHGHARTMAQKYEQLFERLWREKFGRASSAPG
jgi:hypothetical protein